jgi:hypothetical protein
MADNHTSIVMPRLGLEFEAPRSALSVRSCPLAKYLDLRLQPGVAMKASALPSERREMEKSFTGPALAINSACHFF